MSINPPVTADQFPPQFHFGKFGVGSNSLAQLSDTNTTEPPDDCDVLKYDTASSKWLMTGSRSPARGASRSSFQS